VRDSGDCCRRALGVYDIPEGRRSSQRILFGAGHNMDQEYPRVLCARETRRCQSNTAKAHGGPLQFQIPRNEKNK